MDPPSTPCSRPRYPYWSHAEDDLKEDNNFPLRGLFPEGSQSSPRLRLRSSSSDTPSPSAFIKRVASRPHLRDATLNALPIPYRTSGKPASIFKALSMPSLRVSLTSDLGPGPPGPPPSHWNEGLTRSQRKNQRRREKRKEQRQVNAISRQPPHHSSNTPHSSLSSFPFASVPPSTPTFSLGLTRCKQFPGSRSYPHDISTTVSFPPPVASSLPPHLRPSLKLPSSRQSSEPSTSYIQQVLGDLSQPSGSGKSALHAISHPEDNGFWGHSTLQSSVSPLFTQSVTPLRLSESSPSRASTSKLDDNTIPTNPAVWTEDAENEENAPSLATTSHTIKSLTSRPILASIILPRNIAVLLKPSRLPTSSTANNGREASSAVSSYPESDFDDDEDKENSQAAANAIHKIAHQRREYLQEVLLN